MKQYKYIGRFCSDGNEYELVVYCNGYLQAFILLTAQAINLAKHYQLSTITGEDGEVVHVGNISKISDIFSL